MNEHKQNSKQMFMYSNEICTTIPASRERINKADSNLRALPKLFA